MSAAPLWTGGFAERCALCDTPLLTDEETRGICDNCASACTYPEENCPECDDAGCAASGLPGGSVRPPITSLPGAVPRRRSASHERGSSMSNTTQTPMRKALMTLGDEHVAARLDAAETMLDAAKDEVEQVVRQQEREAAFQRAIAVREESKARFEQVKALGAALKALRELRLRVTVDPWPWAEPTAATTAPTETP